MIGPTGVLVSHSIPLYFGTGHPDTRIPPKPSEPVMGPDFTIDPVVYFIETGRADDHLDVAVDLLFASWLRADERAQAYCSHCYLHFTPVEKTYEVQESESCTISFPRNNPKLARDVTLPLDEYLALYLTPTEHDADAPSGAF